jgi:UDP-galactopyranose mutase
MLTPAEPRAGAPASPGPATPPYPIVVLSHLGWDWVWQRPQHLLSRIARRHPVLFVMEPDLIETDDPPRLRTEDRGGNVTVAWPTFSLAQSEAAGGHYHLISPLVDDWLARQGGADPVFWLYTPMAQTAIAGRAGNVIVFDAMDELSAFRFAPPTLKEREALLMRRADLVFTGGQSLYEARKDRNPRVYCFPSGVERAHFAQASDPATPQAAAVAALPHPRVGFYGVIDERIDLDLLGRCAALRPDYQWVMVGPTIKIDEADLPQAPNVIYPGKQEYAALPGFLKGFDVCMMPFALNDSTRFISPTKTLEYMAAHKPIVSTPIHDVVAPYGDIVRIAATPEEFVAAVDAALAESPAARAARAAAEDAILAAHEWDVIAAEMLRLIDEQYAARAASGASARG